MSRRAASRRRTARAGVSPVIRETARVSDLHQLEVCALLVTAGQRDEGTAIVAKGDKEPKGGNPKDAEKWGARKDVNDAFCTECKTWYNSSRQAEVDRHAH